MTLNHSVITRQQDIGSNSLKSERWNRRQTCFQQSRPLLGTGSADGGRWRKIVKRTNGASSMLRCVVRLVRLKDIFCNDINRKGSDGNPETREYVPEHGTVGENGVFTPRLAFCPRIPIQRGWVGHLPEKPLSVSTPEIWTTR